MSTFFLFIINSAAVGVGLAGCHFAVRAGSFFLIALCAGLAAANFGIAVLSLARLV